MSSTLTDIHSDEKVVQLAKELALDGFNSVGRQASDSSEAYKALVSAGSTLWLDTGDDTAASRVWASELGGLTTNNTLINQVIQSGRMDEETAKVGKALKEKLGVADKQSLIVEAAFILNAKIALHLVETFGTKVSVELHPDVAHDWQASVAFGERYYDICPSHFIVKVPMTPDGFITVRKLSQKGIPVNFTLGFGVRQNYFAARFSQTAFVNVFLGRLGVVFKDILPEAADVIGEYVTLASQEAMEALRESGQAETRQIAASIRSGKQVAALAGVDVLTIPPSAAGEYLEQYESLKPVVKHSSSEFKPLVASDDSIQSQIEKLWVVSDEFKAFAEEAVRIGDHVTTGEELIALAEDYGVEDFFHNWTADEKETVKSDGKIPVWVKWAGKVALDELMSQSALLSFKTDQDELDARLAKVIG